MMRIRLDVNGEQVGCLGVWNREEYNDEGEVRYSVYDLRECEEFTDETHLCDVWHHRAYGAASLTVAVMDAVGEAPLDHVYDSRC